MTSKNKSIGFQWVFSHVSTLQMEVSDTVNGYHQTLRSANILIFHGQHVDDVLSVKKNESDSVPLAPKFY